MKSHDIEADFGEEQFVNRTGIMNNPQLGAELIQGAEKVTPPSNGEAAESAEVRAEYLEEASPLGSKPLLVRDNGQNAEVSEQSEAVAVLLDKLGERLAFERQGTRLYEAFLQKFEAVALDGANGPTAAELRHICDEEFDHFHLLQQAIAKLGGDGTVQTPSANIAGVLSKGAVEVVIDPRTTIAQSLQAILTAELTDNDGWQMLNQLAAQLGLEELEEQSRKAFAAEQEHLEKVREWLLAMTLDEAAGGGEIISETEDAEPAQDKVEYHGRSTAGASATEDANNGNALELLKQDHEKVKELFEEAESAENDNQRRKIFKEIKKELDTHTRIEEAIFYPAMLEYDELKDMVLESIEEHKQVKKLLREIGKLGKTSEKFEPKLKVLQENVQHHAEEEEEGKMFPKVRELLEPAQLEELGAELEAAKSQRKRKAS